MINVIRQFLLRSTTGELSRSVHRSVTLPHLVGVVAVFVILLLVKAANIVDTPQFWAEDGRIFFIQARELGWYSLFTPYAGYFHLCTRFLALMASFFDGEYAPVVYFWLSFVIHLLVILVVFWSPLFRDVSSKWLSALALVLIPLGAETFFKITNLHWQLAVLIPLMAVGRACMEFDGRWFCRMLAIVLFGLTDPYIVVFMPFFVLRAFSLRDQKPEGAFFAVTLLCALIQMSSVLMSSGSVSMMPLSHVPMTTTAGYLAFPIRYVLGLFFFPWNCYANREDLPVILTTVCVFIGVVLLVCLAVSASLRLRKMWRHLVFCGLVVAASLVAGVMRGPVAYSADRYYYVPFVFTAFALIGMATGSAGTSQKRVLVWPIAVSRILLAGYFLCSTPVYVLPKVEDLHWRDEYRKAILDPQHAIPIHPTDNPGWQIRIPQ